MCLLLVSSDRAATVLQDKKWHSFSPPSRGLIFRLISWVFKNLLESINLFPSKKAVLGIKGAEWRRTVNKIDHSLYKKRTQKVFGTSNENKSITVSMTSTVRKIEDR